MGRAQGHKEAASAGRRQASAEEAFAAAVGAAATAAPLSKLPGALDMEQVFANLHNSPKEPNWWTPGDFDVRQAEQFIRPGTEGGLDVDRTIALRLLKIDYQTPDFWAYSRWYRPDRRLIQPPAKTCKGMPEAGAMLSQAIDDGQLIAVYCDYDVDGTTAGECLRRGLEPYGARLHYGYADAQQGFGLTNDFVREAHAAGAGVLVTLDCGTGQADQVRLAQSLGLKVIVVDHHNIAENPAEFHLNPKLPRPDNYLGDWPTSDNTGAQLAWKLAAAVQAAREGKTRPEHWATALQLAGMGCLADMGPALLHENRAFFWLAADQAPPGVRALAAALGEDCTTPGAMITTQAALNLPKRTALVSAADIGQLLAAPDVEAAAPMVAKLLDAYESAKPVRRLMLEAALEQTGKAIRREDGSVERPVQAQEDDYLASAVLGEEFSDYAGYTGPVASSVSRTAAKPAVIFAFKGTDQYGQRVYKFSSRNESGAKLTLGGLIEDDAMRQACTLRKLNEAGEAVEAAVVGGHAEVVSGSCTEENIPRVLDAMRAFSKRSADANRGFWPSPWTGPDAFPLERKVAPARLAAIEEQARYLGPFIKGKSQIYATGTRGRDQLRESNRELDISVKAVLRDLRPTDDEKWLTGTLDLGDGITREVRYPADAERPEGRSCEWLLRLGRGAPYYLRAFFDPAA